MADFVHNTNGDFMNREIDLKNYHIRTDLIEESLANYELDENIKREEENYDDINVFRVEILKEVEALNKKCGKYITISFDDVTDSENFDKVYHVFQREFKNLFSSVAKENSKILVVGLGNGNSTPDSLGVRTSDNIVVTRHIFEIDQVSVSEGFRNVASISPGVMGNTGIEALDIIRGVLKEIEVDLVIVIDSLAASSINRLNKTIQITTAGISPGSGIGNYRREISKDTLGVEVLAIGVPTVVDAVTIVGDTISFLEKKISYNKKNSNKPSSKLRVSTMDNYLDSDTSSLTSSEKEELLGMMGTLNEEEIKSLIFEVLTPIGYNLMVTPKEVDFVTEKLSKLLSKGINNSIHDLEKEI